MDPIFSVTDAMLMSEIFGGNEAAINWTKLNYGNSSSVTTLHYSNTWFDITGTGFLECIMHLANSREFALQVDGGVIQRITLNGFNSPYITNNTVVLRRPFKTSMKLTCDVPAGALYDALVWIKNGSTTRGFDHKNWSWVLASTATTTHKGFTHADVTGKGYVIALNGTGSWAVQIDGGPIRPMTHLESRMNRYLGYIRFNSNLKVTSDVAPSNESFVQYFTDPV